MSCGTVQKVATRTWRQECRDIYADYVVYRQGPKAEQSVFLSGVAESRSRLFLGWVMQKLGSPAGGRALDFGCGTGMLFEAELSRANEVIGVDLVLKAAELWTAKRKLGGVRLMAPDVAMREVEAASVNVVVAAEVLEHIDEPTETLAFFRRVLRHDGCLLVSLPTENAAYRFGRRLAGFSGHYHEHDAKAIDKRIQAGGFRLDSSSYIPLRGPLAIYFVGVYRPVGSGA